MKSTFCVMGAGMSGLAAARVLQDRGHSVVVLDKGRGVGGRVATRRHESPASRWDHGAQFVTFRHAEVPQRLAEWGAWDMLQAWHPSPADPARIRYRPLDGMNAFAKALSKGLQLQCGTTVQSLERAGGAWKVHTALGDCFEAGQLILTAPPPQILDLLKASGITARSESEDALRSVRYHRCLSLLVECAGPSGLPSPGLQTSRSAHFSTIIDHQHKGISQLPLVTAHAQPAFSLEWYDRDRALAPAVLRAALAEHLQSPIVHAQVHGWKFAEAAQRIPAPFLELLPGLHAAGDAFQTDDQPPRIESALLSGIACAEALA